MKIDDIIAQIQLREPATSFMPVKSEWFESKAKQYPGMPEELKRLYTTHGYGSIGDSRYMIHCLLDPDEIYDPETAIELEGVFIVGDNFAGNCEAYDAANGWPFGSIGSNGRFEPYGERYQSFTHFLKDWFVRDGT